MKKKILALCLVVVLAVTAVTGATLAYFTDKDQNTNEFSVGGLAIDLYEDIKFEDQVGNPKDYINNDTEVKDQEKVITYGKGDDTNPNIKYKDIMPGDVMTKIATVENKENYPTYVALAIKQDNYKQFNDNIDEHYEAALKKEGKTQEEINAAMEEITDSIFTGTGWDVGYTKDGNYTLRYMMRDPKGTVGTLDGAADNAGVEVLGYGYTNVDSTAKEAGTVDYSVHNYAGAIFDSFKSKPHTETVDGNFTSLDGAYTRMWIIYLKMDPKTSYTVDLTTECPSIITTDNIEAFKDMTLDIQASAIQVDGFADAKAAFTELFKTYGFNY